MPQPNEESKRDDSLGRILAEVGISQEEIDVIAPRRSAQTTTVPQISHIPVANPPTGGAV